MKKLGMVLGILLLSSFSYADQWPYDPVCRSYGADSETVKTFSNPPEKVVLCKFGFRSYVDKSSLGRPVPTWAVSNYQRNTEILGRSCSEFGAHIVQARNDQNRAFLLCRFLDRSYMEHDTFMEGPDSITNFEMNQALLIY